MDLVVLTKNLEINDSNKEINGKNKNHINNENKKLKEKKI